MQHVFNIVVQTIKVIAFYLACHMPVLASENVSVLAMPKADSGFVQIIKVPPSRPRRN